LSSESTLTNNEIKRSNGSKTGDSPAGQGTAQQERGQPSRTGHSPAGQGTAQQDRAQPSRTGHSPAGEKDTDTDFKTRQITTRRVRIRLSANSNRRAMCQRCKLSKTDRHATGK